jgi:hypothetical protein
MLARQTQGPEFKPQYHQKKKKNEDDKDDKTKDTNDEEAQASGSCL